MGVQSGTEVSLGSAGHNVNQIYASAMPIAYAPAPLPDWEPLARLVLDAAYLATLAAAWRSVQSGQSGSTPRLFLTRLGGGAFGNPSSWITAAIAAALNHWAAAPLDVVMVSYGRADPANQALLARFFRPTKLTLLEAEPAPTAP